MEEMKTGKIHNQKITFIIIGFMALSIFIGLNASPIVVLGSSYSIPAGFIEPTATSNTTGEIVFGTFSPSPHYNEIVILVRINGTASGFLKFPENNGTMNWTGGPENGTALYFNLNPADGTLNPGDYIEFTGLSPSTLYSFYVYYIPGKYLVSLVGDTDFGTPPDPPLDISPSGTFPSLPTPEDIQEEKPSDLIPILIIIVSIIGLISLLVYFLLA